MYQIEEIKNKILQGDCLEIMKDIPDNSIDTIITDPPYELGFMGKKWDNSGIAFQIETWKEALRIAKPGATMLVFGGTRTWHRLACAIEDAGWIIKDTLMWLTGQGFPKATDISKQIDKKFGAERDKKLVPTKKGNLPEQAGEIALGATGMTDISEPQTPETKLWNGWKSHGLKPAYEPIIMAMKKNEGSYAENALKWGVAGLNIDAGRIGTEKVNVHDAPKGTFAGGEQGRGSIKNYREYQGRFPANILLSEEAAKMLDGQSGVSGGKYKAPNARPRKGFMIGNVKGISNAPDNYGDKGGASRFFYVAKASKRERNMGCEEFKPKIRNDGRNKELKSGDVPQNRSNNPKQNFHPTVKPLKLMEYLVKLTSMPNPDQIYLDPFLGSGTTAMACKKLGKNWVGIEKEPEYIKIAEARIKAIQQPLNI